MHAAHMTCHTQYEYVGYEAGGWYNQTVEGYSIYIRVNIRVGKRGNEGTHDADAFAECAWRKVGSEF
jgi:hypothetical protein